MAKKLTDLKYKLCFPPPHFCQTAKWANQEKALSLTDWLAALLIPVMRYIYRQVGGILTKHVY